MGITIASYLSWTGFNPGPAFLGAHRSSQYEHRWYKPELKAGTETEFVPVIPSVLSAPSSDEWRTDISAVEWKSLGAIWTIYAQEILRNDPVFNEFRIPWCATADGLWTEQFRKHSSWNRMARELFARMSEMFEFNRKLVGDVERIGPQSFESGIEDDAAAPLGFGKWIKTSVAISRTYGWWTPTGLAWNIGLTAATFALDRYLDNRAEKARRQELRDHYNKHHYRSFLDTDDEKLPTDWSVVNGDDDFAGFHVKTGRMGLIVTLAERTTKYDWRSLTGAPNVLVSHDGSYI